MLTIVSLRIEFSRYPKQLSLSVRQWVPIKALTEVGCKMLVTAIAHCWFPAIPGFVVEYCLEVLNVPNNKMVLRIGLTHSTMPL
jgi:hypothetical protein